MTSTSSTSSASKPRILAISLSLSPDFDRIHKDVLNAITTQAVLQRAKKPETVIRQLESPLRPDCVIITDGVLVRHHAGIYQAAFDAVVRFVREDGGIAICAFDFSNELAMDKVGAFFRKAGLPWTHGSYHRTTVHLNRDSDFFTQQPVNAVNLADPLPKSYSLKALFLKKVPRSDALYNPNEDSVVEAYAARYGTDPFEKVLDLAQTHAALAKLGKGKLGYLSDTNDEPGTGKVLLAMLGLDGANAYIKYDPNGQPLHVGTTSSADISFSAGKPSGVEAVPGPENTIVPDLKDWRESDDGGFNGPDADILAARAAFQDAALGREGKKKKDEKYRPWGYGKTKTTMLRGVGADGEPVMQTLSDFNTNF